MSRVPDNIKKMWEEAAKETAKSSSHGLRNPHPLLSKPASEKKGLEQYKDIKPNPHKPMTPREKYIQQKEKEM